MLPSIHKLRQRLFSSNRYLQSLGDVVVTQSDRLSSVWIIGRGSCTYHLVDLSHLDSKARMNALRLQMEMLSPYSEIEFWVHWVDGVAEVWSWDKSSVEKLVIENLRESDARELITFVPESAFTPRQEQGLAYWQGADGFLIQSWANGVLTHERAWKTEPSAIDLREFANASRTSLSGESLAVKQIDLSVPEWRVETVVSQNLRTYEPRAVFFLSLLLVSVFAYQAFTWVGMRALNYRIESEILNLEQKTASVTLLRDEVYELYDRNRVLLDLAPQGQLQLMQKVLRELPAIEGDKGALMKWEYRGDQLTMLLKNPRADLEVYATALDNIEEFEAITLTPKDRDKALEIKVEVNR